MRAKILIGVVGVLALCTGVANAQYYYGNNNYNYGYGNNPNNGVTFFVGDSNWNNNYDYNNGYYGGTYYNNYVQPVSISVPNNWNNNYNFGYNYNYNNLTYYNNSSLFPTTYAATNAGQNSATVNGYVTVSGNAYNNQTIGTTWFQYGISQSNLNWSTNPANVYYTTNTNAYLTGLNCGTTYYYRAVTSGQNGLQYGNTLAFTTSQCNWNYNNGYYGGVYYPNYNYQNWQPPQIQTKCYKPAKRIVKKKYY